MRAALRVSIALSSLLLGGMRVTELLFFKRRFSGAINRAKLETNCRKALHTPKKGLSAEVMVGDSGPRIA